MRRLVQTKVIKEALLKKEGEILKVASIYCATHNLELNGEHKKLLKCVLRKFFREAVAPMMRDIYEDNVKNYDE